MVDPQDPDFIGDEAYDLLERVGRNALILVILALHALFFSVSLELFFVDVDLLAALYAEFWLSAYIIAVFLVLPAIWSVYALWAVFRQTNLRKKREYWFGVWSYYSGSRFILAWQEFEDFNPKSLNTSTIKTPVMEQIRATSQEAMLQQLGELLEEDGRGAIPQGKLIEMAQQELRINANRLNHMMPDLGWQLKKAKWGGKDYARAIWVRPGYAIHRANVTGPDDYDHPIDKQPGYTGFDFS